MIYKVKILLCVSNIFIDVYVSSLLNHCVKGNENRYALPININYNAIIY